MPRRRHSLLGQQRVGEVTSGMSGLGCQGDLVPGALSLLQDSPAAGENRCGKRP